MSRSVYARVKSLYWFAFWDLVNESFSKKDFLFRVLSDECACNQYKVNKSYNLLSFTFRENVDNIQNYIPKN